MNNLYQTNPFNAYAEQLARVANPLLIHRLKAAGLNRAFRRRLASLSSKGQLRGHHFPFWLVASLYANHPA